VPFPLPPSLSERRLGATIFAVFFVVVAPFHWLLTEALSPDGVSYLDLSRAAAAGGFEHLVNSYWAPLLPLLLTPVVGLRGHFAFASVAYAQIALSLVSVLVFVGGWSLVRATWREKGWQPGMRLSPQEVAVACFLMSLLLAAFVGLCGPHVLTPDALAGAFCLLASAELVRAQADGFPMERARLAGLWLGCGYLAKYPVFVFTLLLIALVAYRRPRFGMQMALGFGVVATPWVALLSEKYGRLTFADSGWLNLAWFTGQAPKYAGYGMEASARWEAHGTYAPWLDPAWFHAGLHVNLPWRRLGENTLWHLSWWWRSPVFSVVVVSVLLLLCLRRPRLDWRLLWPALAIASYLPVTLMTRYAAFWVFLLLGFWGLRAIPSAWHSQVAVALLLAACGAWFKISSERARSIENWDLARQTGALRGAVVGVEGDAFAASLVLHRIEAKIESQSSTIKGPWQILDSSGSVLWVIPWRATLLKQGTRSPFGPTVETKLRSWQAKKAVSP
jgi:hypothetical protein